MFGNWQSMSNAKFYFIDWFLIHLWNLWLEPKILFDYRDITYFGLKYLDFRVNQRYYAQNSDVIGVNQSILNFLILELENVLNFLLNFNPFFDLDLRWEYADFCCGFVPLKLLLEPIREIIKLKDLYIWISCLKYITE